MMLDDEIALLTGASSGIGQWTATGLLNEGARVLAPVRDLERGMTTNIVHTGPVATRIQRSPGRLHADSLGRHETALDDPRKGAETTLYVATAAELANSKGLVFIKKRPAEVNKLIDDANFVAQLWDETKRLSGVAG